MYEYRARTRVIHDGDTLRADVDLGFGVWISNMPLRLAGINAPELGNPGGREARDWLRNKLPAGSLITIRTYKDATEKYGRMLTDIWLGDPVSGTSINQQLIAVGHALPWDGQGVRPETAA